MNYIVAICDDDRTQVEIVNDYIENFSFKTNYDIKVIKAYTGEELLRKLDSEEEGIGIADIDIFLLDIEMNEMNGIDLAKKIKQKNKKAIIVYITGFKDYALYAFQIRAFHYMMKPITYKNFEILLNEIIENLKVRYLKKETDKIFVVKNKGAVLKIPYMDIFYFEKSLRKTIVTCKSESTEFYASFKNLIKELDMNYFTQCHQSFIVNNSKIYSYKNKEIYIRELNERIPVSKGCVKEVKKALSDKLFEWEDI